ncbi:MAG TPA: TonB-dependent receptor [Saprospiraceae bacterium]|nr:TonB-dependent receptor [Saprospiraceae bacterium]
MSKRFLLSSFFLFQGLWILAHNMILGRVTNASTGEIITGATIFIPSKQRGTVSDELGSFKLTGLPDQEYDITISFLGFETQNFHATSNVRVEIRLMPAILDLSEIVVSNQRDLSKNMTIISKIDLELRPTHSSQDILRMIPGLVTAQHAGGGKAEQIYLRGFDIDHGTDVRVAVDDMPVNMVSHAHGQGYADLHFLIPELIDYVDFNKGPYYAQHGDFTTAGYANFKTKNALDRSLIKIEAGRFDTYRTVGLIDLLSDNPDNHNNAFFASDLTVTNGPFESPQHFNRINLMGKYNGLIGKNKVLTISLSTFTSRWEASGQIPDRAVKNGLINRFGAIDDNEGGNTTRTNANIQLLNILDNGDQLRNQFYYTKYQFRLFSNFTFFLNDPVHGDEIRQAESRDLFGYNLSYIKESNLGSMSLRTEAGMNIRFDKTKNSELAHTFKRNTFLGYYALGDIDELNTGLYVDEVLKVNDRLSVNAGLRFDQFGFGYIDLLDSLFDHPVVYANTLSPKLNIYYNANENIQLYLKTGIGFHSNDARVVVPENGIDILPKAYGMDIGTFIKPSRNLLVNLAAWFLDLDQEFVYVGDEAVVEPSGKTRRYGFDLSARYQANDWLFVDADFNYTVPRSREGIEGENFIPLAPTFTSIGGITTKFGKGFNASLRYRFVGDRPANENNTVTALGYFLLDGGVTYTATRSEFGISLENILNVDWNEAQFDTESRLYNEPASVAELHYTPGTPFFIKGSATFFF